MISQPGLLFSFDPDHGYTGLLNGKKAAANDITTIRFQPNLATTDPDTGRQAAPARARDAARTF